MTIKSMLSHLVVATWWALQFARVWSHVVGSNIRTSQENVALEFKLHILHAILHRMCLHPKCIILRYL